MSSLVYITIAPTTGLHRCTAVELSCTALPAEVAAATVARMQLAASSIASYAFVNASSVDRVPCSRLIVQCAKHCLINTDGYSDVYYRVVSSCQLIVIASDNGQRANLLHDVVTNMRSVSNFSKQLSAYCYRVRFTFYDFDSGLCVVRYLSATAGMQYCAVAVVTLVDPAYRLLIVLIGARACEYGGAAAAAAAMPALVTSTAGTAAAAAAVSGGSSSDYSAARTSCCYC
eukprot:4007-Heterococcus_DN1.PRE.4